MIQPNSTILLQQGGSWIGGLLNLLSIRFFNFYHFLDLNEKNNNSYLPGHHNECNYLPLHYSHNFTIQTKMKTFVKSTQYNRCHLTNIHAIFK